MGDRRSTLTLQCPASILDNKSRPFLRGFMNTCHPGWTWNEPPVQEPKVIAACQESINQSARFRGDRTSKIYQAAIPSTESERKTQVRRQVFVGGEDTLNGKSVTNSVWSKKHLNAPLAELCDSITMLSIKLQDLLN